MNNLALLIGYSFMVIGGFTLLAYICFYLPRTVWFKISPLYNARIRHILSLGHEAYMDLPPEERKGWRR